MNNNLYLGGRVLRKQHIRGGGGDILLGTTNVGGFDTGYTKQPDSFAVGEGLSGSLAKKLQNLQVRAPSKKSKNIVFNL